MRTRLHAMADAVSKSLHSLRRIPEGCSEELNGAGDFGSRKDYSIQ